MLTDEDRDSIRAIVREETERIVGEHVASMVQACILPINIAICQVFDSLRLQADSINLIEKSLAGAFDDGERWQEPIGDDDG